MQISKEELQTAMGYLGEQLGEEEVCTLVAKGTPRAPCKGMMRLPGWSCIITLLQHQLSKGSCDLPMIFSSVYVARDVF